MNLKMNGALIATLCLLLVFPIFLRSLYFLGIRSASVFLRTFHFSGVFLSQDAPVFVMCLYFLGFASVFLIAKLNGFTGLAGRRGGQRRQWATWYLPPPPPPAHEPSQTRASLSHPSTSLLSRILVSCASSYCTCPPLWTPPLLFRIPLCLSVLPTSLALALSFTL